MACLFEIKRGKESGSRPLQRSIGSNGYSGRIQICPIGPGDVARIVLAPQQERSEFGVGAEQFWLIVLRVQAVSVVFAGSLRLPPPDDQTELLPDDPGAYLMALVVGFACQFADLRWACKKLVQVGKSR